MRLSDKDTSSKNNKGLESEKSLDEDEIKELDTQHVMGYISWINGRFGAWVVFKTFFAKSMFNQTVEKVFFQIGFAIGTFFMSKFWLKEIISTMNLPSSILEYN